VAAEEKVPATKYGQAVIFPIFGGCPLFSSRDNSRISRSGKLGQLDGSRGRGETCRENCLTPIARYHDVLECYAVPQKYKFGEI
jgi:hypothetical protein